MHKSTLLAALVAGCAGMAAAQSTNRENIELVDSRHAAHATGEVGNFHRQTEITALAPPPVLQSAINAQFADLPQRASVTIAFSRLIVQRRHFK